jgi:hypothetical protein
MMVPTIRNQKLKNLNEHALETEDVEQEEQNVLHNPYEQDRSNR